MSQHDFGGVFGGPVAIPKLYDGRDRTFFFASYEAYRNKTSAAPQTVDHPGRRRCTNGDFSQWRNASGQLIPIYDPATTRPNPNGPGFIRDPFPNNQIPVERFSRISREVIQLATMRPDLPGVRNNFAYTSGDQINTNPWNKFSVKVDHNLSTKDRLGFLMHWGEVLVVPPGDGPSGGLPVPLNNFRDEDSHTYVYRANWDRVITPALMNRVTFGHNNWYQLRASYNRDQGWGTRIGLQNVPGPDKLFPLIDFSDDYLDWGRSEWGGSGNYLWNISDDLTWVKSRHTMKAGFTFQEDRYDGYGWHTAAGTYNFNRGATAGFLANGNLDTTGASGNAFASFLLGEVQSSEITTNRYVSDRWRYYSAYIQDDWRVNNKLTVNYGLRYEYTPPTWEGHFPDGYSNFNPELPNPAAGGHLGASEFAGDGRGPHRREDDVRRLAVGLQPAPRRRLQPRRRDRRAVQRGAHLRPGEEHRRQLALAGLHRRLQRDRAGLPGELRVQLGRRLAVVAGAAVPGAADAERQQHPLLAAVRLGPPARVLLVDAEHAAAAARPLRRRGRLQRPARAPPAVESPRPQSGRPGHLPGLRPAVRRRRRHQPDELAHGLDAGAAGQHPLPVRHLPGIAVGAAGAAAVPAVPRHRDRPRRRRAGRAFELSRLRAEGREALRRRPDVPDARTCSRRPSRCAPIAPTPATGGR